MTTTRPPICFVDTETDGLHHGRQAWEIAIIRRDTDPDTGDGVERWTESTWHVLVHLPSMRTSDNFALAKGGFWDRHPTGRQLSGKPAIPTDVPLVSARAAAREIAVLTHGAHIVGVNPTFDVEIFASMLRAEGLTPQWDYHLEDLVAETVGYLRGGRATADAISPAQWARTAPRSVTDLPWRSDELARAVGVEDLPEGERHTALGDARWARRWHDILASFAGSVALR
ncbi:hypothetical protein F9L07_28460 [Pimelobacter simplex]|uniref:Exonuclease domain-containing protein n=1 Tax=Nocardioides simplex TaxID=2045 RepID=A0A7J5DQL3_NOCSI|nr:hypothetical protein [Pimelobacter simplex]KAB2806968.1 hypothetical protein F9L07_28460 [Pimelobacter simplex]